jgi:myo-inositol-1(or 4)-monophosphatase
VDLITRNFPDDGIQGEEGAFKPSRSGYVWFLDPIDGTTVYSLGFKEYGISAGRARDGRADFGIVHFPTLGYTIVAMRGAGAWLDDQVSIRPLREKPSQRTLRESAAVIDTRIEDENIFRKPFRETCLTILKYGSCVYESSLVAQGLLGVYLNNTSLAHDVAAVSIIAEETGCLVSDLDGKPIDLRNKKVPIVIAGTPEIMEETLRLYNNQLQDHLTALG